MQGIAIQLESNESAQLHALQGNVAVLISPRAFAPGAPIRFFLRRQEGSAELAPELAMEFATELEGRSLGSVRTEVGLFEVRMRFVSLRKNHKTLLTQLLSNVPNTARLTTS